MEEIRLDLAELKYRPPEEVREAFRQSASEINRYPSGEYPDLKDEFASYLSVEKDQVCFSNGLDEMIDIVTGIWGGTNFVPVPTFSQFAEASKRRGQKTVEVSMLDEGRYSLEPDKIDFGSDIIWICTPNNPTGTVIDQQKIEEVCRKASGKVVVDECYAEFAGNSCIYLIQDYSNLIVLRSFSKSFGLAGLRLGAAISSRENIREIEEYRQPFNVSRPAAKTAKAALRNSGQYREIREKILQTGKEFSDFLEDRELETNEVNGNFLLVKFRNREEAETYYEGLQRLNISVFPGWDEEFSGLPGKFLRFNIGTEEQMKEVQNRFKILENKLSQEKKI